MPIRALKPLYDLYQRQRFLPDWRGIFVNPYYILRRGLVMRIGPHAARQQGRVLDLGCGISPYRELFTAAREYIRMDIEFAHESTEDIVFFDGKTIPADDGAFDAVLCTEVLEHAADLDVLVSEIRRVMRPGAQAIVTIPFIWEEHGYPRDFRRFTLVGAKAFFETNGFAVLAGERVGRYASSAAQLRCNNLMRQCPSDHLLIQILFCVVFIAPLTLLGLFTSWIVPGSPDFYLGVFLLLQKPPVPLVSLPR